MADQKPFNLFIYGTLMNPSVFRAVLGQRLVISKAEADDVELFHARRAVLTGYKKVSPDNTYLYAVPDPHGRIRGYLVGPLPGEHLILLRRYEGKNYSRKRLRVQTKDGVEEAIIFIGNLKELEHSFGYAFHDKLKQEVLLSRKIDEALEETEREQLHTTETFARRALGELHGDTIRDLTRQHFEAGGISDYAIRRSLKDTPLLNFDRITADPEAKALAPNYLTLVIRQVLFNQIEEKIRRDFRYELDHMPLRGEYYERTVSSLAALRLLNTNVSLINMLVHDCLNELNFHKDRLIDFVRWSIVAADSFYDPQAGRSEIKFIQSHMGQGHIPLGAELEFSNIGHDVINDPQGAAMRDLRYDGFLYFSDFGLDVLTWKLGGHIDDHYEKASRRPRRGFFEVALGNLSVEANISKPITDDPWLLNQFVHEARRFYEITPHSVHISLQLRSQHKPSKERLLSLEVMKCLFAVAGDPTAGGDGRLQIRRLVTDEIIRANPNLHMLFSEISRRRSSDADDSHLVVADRLLSGRYIQQFKFLRLSPEINYEPIIMCLKGLQMSLRPGSFMTVQQYVQNPRHRQLFEELIEWGRDIQPIPKSESEVFLGYAYDGLMSERRGRPAHSEAYIAWSLNQVRTMLEDFNALVRGQAPSQTSR
ncbi:MAG: gamma-glutamylcyclotransferase [Phycisphaerae bacterium]|nr:gamma-glutamylcyclotransferase [Phycisphaerae bacterium]